MLDAIRSAWGWTGLRPIEVLDANAFGNVIVRAADGAYWRICPEDLSCAAIARDEIAFAALRAERAFQIDWRMERLVEIAAATLGPVDGERCYCLKVPSVLGGLYDADNFGEISRIELLAASGEIARQIADVPDGQKVQLKIARGR